MFEDIKVGAKTVAAKKRNLVQKKESKIKTEWINFYKTTTTPGGGLKFTFSKLSMVEVMTSLGIYRYDHDAESMILHIVDNVAEQINQRQVVDLFEDWYLSHLDKNERDPNDNYSNNIIDKLYNGLATYFSPVIIDRCRPKKPIKFNEHQKEKAFYYYKNGFVEVTPNGFDLKPYSELKNCIWQEQILDREFKKLNPKQYKSFPFRDFFDNLCGNYPDPDTGKRFAADRVEAFRTNIGYMLHAFFNYDLYCINFTDSVLDSGSNGRSGKTVIGRAIQCMVNKHYKKGAIAAMIAGKNFDVNYKFKYQNLEVYTKCVLINDTNPNLDLEKLFNDITDGLEYQKKNEGAFSIFVKMGLISNKPLVFKGESERGRFVEFEFSEFYNSNNRPATVHGEWFFDTWTPSKWAQFDNFMLESIQLFLKKGVIKAREINLQERKLLEQCPPEFIQWMEYRLKGDEKNNMPAIESGTFYDKKALCYNFKSMYEDHANVAQRTFAGWLSLFAETKKELFFNHTSKQGGGKQLISFDLKKVKEPAATQEQLPF